jgi:hypothetical protein
MYPALSIVFLSELLRVQLNELLLSETFPVLLPESVPGSGCLQMFGYGGRQQVQVSLVVFAGLQKLCGVYVCGWWIILLCVHFLFFC